MAEESDETSEGRALTAALVDGSDALAIERGKLEATKRKQLLDNWAKQEDVAMHFNDLAMRLRLQALAGIGAAALVASSIFTNQGKSDPRQIGAVLVAAAFVWLGIWLMDVFYYQRLLKGAVESLKLLEQHALMKEVQLSTTIENAVQKDGAKMRNAFYVIVGALLSLGGLALIIGGFVWPPATKDSSTAECVKLCVGGAVSVANASTPAPTPPTAPTLPHAPGTTAPTMPGSAPDQSR